MFIVFDLEATCWATPEETAQNKSEIIQIGAVKVDLHKGEIIDTFDYFVRPKHSKKLSEYCKNLTGIQDYEVRSGGYFEEVYPKFLAFCGSKHKHTLVAWGAYDGHTIQKACEENNLIYKLPRHYVNAALLFKERMGLPKKIGLALAVELCGLDFVGRPHNALWDAYQTAIVFAHTFGVKLNA